MAGGGSPPAGGSSVYGGSPAGHDAAASHDAAAGDTGVFACSLPRFCGGVPGILCSFILTGAWEGWRIFRFSVPVRNGKGRLREGPLLRGEYEVRGEVELRDILSLSRFSVVLPEAETLLILPADIDPVPVEAPPATGGARSAGKRMRRRGDEFFDTRKYVPGDDIRRINWKQFAHARELILRIPERVPPPEARHRIVLEMTWNDGGGAAGKHNAAGKGGAAGATDYRAGAGLLPAADWAASAALSLARILCDRGLSVSITFLGGNTRADISDPAVAAAILAGTAPRSRDAGKEAESLDRSGLSAADEVFLFSIAQDPDDIPALGILRARGIEPAVILPPSPGEKGVVTTPGPFRFAAVTKHTSEAKHAEAENRAAAGRHR